MAFRQFIGKKMKYESIVSSIWTPASDGSVVQWLNATVITPQTDNTGLATWPASIGNNAVQATSINQPAYRTAASASNKNGLPVVEHTYVANPQYMTTTSFGTINQPFTVWVVAKFTLFDSFYFAFDGLGATNRANLYTSAGGGWNMSTDGGAAATGVEDTNWHIFQCFFNGAASTLTIDGGAPAAMNAVGAGNFVGVTLGADYADSVQGHITFGEFVVQTGSTNASLFRTYFNNRWAIY